MNSLAHHQHRAEGVGEHRLTVRADELSNLSRVCATEGDQLDGFVMSREEVRDAAAHRGGLHVHLRITPRPRAEASIELVVGDFAQTGRPHAQREDGRVP